MDTETNQEFCESGSCCRCYCVQWFCNELSYYSAPLYLNVLYCLAPKQYQRLNIRYRLELQYRTVDDMLKTTIKNHLKEVYQEFVHCENKKQSYDLRVAHILEGLVDQLQSRFYLMPENEGVEFSYDPVDLVASLKPDIAFVYNEWKIINKDYDRAFERYTTANNFMTLAVERLSFIKYSLTQHKDLDIWKEVDMKMSLESKEGENLKKALDELQEQLTGVIEKLKNTKDDSKELNNRPNGNKELNKQVNYNKEQRESLYKLCAKIGIPYKKKELPMITNQIAPEDADENTRLVASMV